MRLNIFFLITSATILFLITACSGESKNIKSLGGWKVNDVKGWFFTSAKVKDRKLPGMVYVEGGTFTMGRAQDDVLRDWNNSPVRMQVSSFYMSETEVTNYDYRSYLAWLEYVFPPENPSFKEIYNGALPSTSFEKEKLMRNDVYTNHYFTHPAFDNYPVIGVSWIQAQRFCEWLTDRANENVLMEAGFLSKDLYRNAEIVYGTKHFDTEIYKRMPYQMFGDDSRAINPEKFDQDSRSDRNRRLRYLGKYDGLLVSKFRLPTETEWEYTALALAKNRSYNSYKGKRYPDDRVRFYKGRNKGDFLDNFKIGHGDYSGVGGWGNDGSTISNEVKKYPPNDLGFFGMYGNVSEWTADVYRPVIDDEINDLNYFRGNVYKRLVLKDGIPERVMSEPEYDILADGRKIYKGLPGSIKKEVTQDAKNYRDGDLSSVLDPYSLKEDSSVTEKVYNAPVRNFIVDTDGKVKVFKDKKSRTSSVSDRMRVIKGASYKDGVYWTDPAQRRYMDERESTSWIGFRVAQDVLGDKKNKRTRRGRQ